MICEEVLSRLYSPIPRIAVSCFYPLSCYPETTDSRGLSEEGSLVPQVGWGRPQVYVRLRRTGASWMNAEEHQREGEGTRAEKPRKRRRGSGKASTRRRDRARTGKRKTNKAKWRGLTMWRRKRRIKERIADETQKRDCASIREIETVFFSFESPG